ncbi:uncharacterized protein [Dysidea avara]|uniref:uncharacterized protein n=1 Tax=Dysidea avara TaxID=196820 RepID=UPI00331C8D58
MATDSVTLDVTVPTPALHITPSGPIQGAVVGGPQDIRCIASTVSGVDIGSVSFNWMLIGGGLITSSNNSNRVSISPTTTNDSSFTSTLQFDYVTEEDDGIYVCTVVILETDVSEFVEIETFHVPTPNATVSNISTQIVGKSLMLECNVTTVRGIISSVDIVWNSYGIELQRMNGINPNYSQNDFMIYRSVYIIPLLSTTDDGGAYQCEVMINTSPPVMATDSVTLDVTVPTPTVSITPSGPIQGAMVGSPHDIQCTVSTVSGVEPHLILISWMGPGGDTITNDSRVTISPTSGSGNNYTSSLQFMYLMEGDEGTYECNVMILETSVSDIVQMSNFTVQIEASRNTAGDNDTSVVFIILFVIATVLCILFAILVIFMVTKQRSRSKYPKPSNQVELMHVAQTGTNRNSLKDESMFVSGKDVGTDQTEVMENPYTVDNKTNASTDFEVQITAGTADDQLYIYNLQYFEA